MKYDTICAFILLVCHGATNHLSWLLHNHRHLRCFFVPLGPPEHIAITVALDRTAGCVAIVIYVCVYFKVRTKKSDSLISIGNGLEKSGE